MTMSWERLLNATRLGDRPSKHEPGRTPFNSDHDKIVFSGAFRRLGKKTQVHPLATNDHVHNRLTHSLEVACVGRSLGVRVGEHLRDKQELPDTVLPTDLGDIVQSACLAHDIGNPPFGHIGEEAIQHWFGSERGLRHLDGLEADEIDDLTQFEGNAQGFRVLTTSEYHAYNGGLRLTYATLGAFMKYPWVYGRNPDAKKQHKFGVYLSEVPQFHEVAQATGLLEKDDDRYCRHPLAHLMELADDFCYALLDLEDGIEMGVLRWDEVYDIFQPVLPAKKHAALDRELGKLREGRRPPLIRGEIISAFVEDGARAFIEHEQALLAGEVHALFDLCSPQVRDCIKAAKGLAQAKVFHHARKIEVEIGAYNVIGTLLDVIGRAVMSNPKHDAQARQVLNLIGPSTFGPSQAEDLSSVTRYDRFRRAIDFISGMTDNYATYLAKQFNGMGEVR